jgi:UDP-2,4-diacetamido-2,4,6-trideoxy-beta-L-altropyranose hydrolase
MTIVFRVDASRHTGFGHLQRCLALASAPAWRDIDREFVVRGDESARQRIERRGCQCTLLPATSTQAEDLAAAAGPASAAADRIVVIDSRTIDPAYRSTLRSMGVFVVSIDDLASDALPSDVVVNSNVFAGTLDYGRLAPDAQLFLGLDFALLQPEFWDVGERIVADQVQCVLIVLGASDHREIMPSLIAAVGRVEGDFAIDVVVGPLFEHAERVREAADRWPGRVRLLPAPASLVQPMCDADVAVSAGGQTLYELVRVGCPTIALEVSHDQREQIDRLARLGCVRNGGGSPDGTQVTSALRELIDRRDARAMLSRTAQTLIDGQGVIRISEALLRLAGRPRGDRSHSSTLEARQP